MSIEIRIVCDECKRVHEYWGWGFANEGAKAHALRKALREKSGWETNLRGGRDICRECAERAREEGGKAVP